MERSFQVVKLSKIKPYERNNKKHDKNVDRIADSIQRNEYISPIIIDEKNVILAGHGRKLALDKLGIKEIEVLQVTGLTDKQKADFRIADNRTTELSEWDYEAVLAEIEEFGLEELKVDFPDLDFDAVDLNEEAEDEVPDMDNVEIIVQKGDIFQLGDHRLMCGDATSIEDIELLMDGKKADMVFTDPPFPNNSGIMHDMIDGIDRAFDCARENTKGLMIRFWDNLSFPPFVEDVTSKYIRNKTNGRQAEHFETMYAYHGDKQRHEQLVFSCNNVGGDMKRADIGNHPTPKPVTLPEQIFEKLKYGNLVLDMFLGSGSTLIACEKTNRVCYGTELDPKYIQVILKRYHDYTKGQREIKCLNRDLDLTPILNGK